MCLCNPLLIDPALRECIHSFTQVSNGSRQRHTTKMSGCDRVKGAGLDRGEQHLDLSLGEVLGVVVEPGPVSVVLGVVAAVPVLVSVVLEGVAAVPVLVSVVLEVDLGLVMPGWDVRCPSSHCASRQSLEQEEVRSHLGGWDLHTCWALDWVQR